MTDPFSYQEIEVEEFDPDEWKLLFTMLCENRAKHDFSKGLTPYGQVLLDSVSRKVGIRVVGVEASAGLPSVEPDRCPLCNQPKMVINGDITK